MCVCVWGGGCNIINFYLSFNDFSNTCTKHANENDKGQRWVLTSLCWLCIDVIKNTSWHRVTPPSRVGVPTSKVALYCLRTMRPTTTLILDRKPASWRAFLSPVSEHDVRVNIFCKFVCICRSAETPMGGITSKHITALENRSWSDPWGVVLTKTNWQCEHFENHLLLIDESKVLLQP